MELAKDVDRCNCSASVQAAMATEVTESPGARVVGNPVIVPVTFRFPKTLVPNARRIAIRGSFNAWQADAHLLRKGADGEWGATVYLCPSRIVYYFDVDGVPWLDPDDDGRVPNEWGSEYSVRRIGEAAPAPPTTRLGDQLSLL